VFFSTFSRRVDHWRAGLGPALITVGFLAFRAFAGDTRDAEIIGLTSGQFGGSSTFLITTLVMMLFPAGVAIFFSAGYATIPESDRVRWTGLTMLSRGQLLSRPVGREIAAGLMLGPALAALLFLPAAFGWAPDAYPRHMSHFTTLMPGASAFDTNQTWQIALLCAFALPWALSLRRLKWPALILLAVFATAMLSVSLESYRETPGANYAAGLLVACGLALIYRYWGVLACWIASSALYGSLTSSVLLRAPSEGLQAVGVQILFLWLGLLVLAVLFGWRGTETDEHTVIASMAARERQHARSDRDRLRSEFEVARRAQQGMLPNAPPQLPGYEMCASCLPALEVGGDLFDFLKFPDGRIGMSVADVSGKGVPASLYMTLTKGMLSAAAQEPPDLVRIASGLNRHLKDWGGKKTFVTLSMALLDGRTGTVEHVRAGHNPPLLYRAAERRAEYCKPSGIGLGLVSPALFRKTLETERLELAPGDALILYSDGLTECMNESRELFGEARLKDVVEESAAHNAEEVRERILTAARQFQGLAEPHDDLTVLVLIRTANGAAAPDGENGK
jgi:serine phosphatase RsbU (regulator of sigma subunit)